MNKIMIFLNEWVILILQKLNLRIKRKGTTYDFTMKYLREACVSISLILNSYYVVFQANLTKQQFLQNETPICVCVL